MFRTEIVRLESDEPRKLDIFLLMRKEIWRFLRTCMKCMGQQREFPFSGSLDSELLLHQSYKCWIRFLIPDKDSRVQCIYWKLYHTKAFWWNHSACSTKEILRIILLSINQHLSLPVDLHFRMNRIQCIANADFSLHGQKVWATIETFIIPTTHIKRIITWWTDHIHNFAEIHSNAIHFNLLSTSIHVLNKFRPN